MDPTSIQEAKYKTQAFFALTRDTFEAGFAKMRREETGPLDVAIIKATFQDELVPKEKHVQTLIQASNGENANYVVHGLIKRLEENSKAWLVTLKSLIVLHRLLREAGASFCNKLNTYADGVGQADLLRRDSFNDDTTMDTLRYSTLVRAYSVYLNERLAAFRSFDQFDPARDVDAATREVKLKAAPASELLANLPALQRSLAGLLACVPEGAAESHDVSVFAATLALSELEAVYGICAGGVQNLIARVGELKEQDDAMKVVLTVKEAVALNKQMRVYEDAVNRIPKLQGAAKFPDLQVFPEDVLPNLEAYLQSPPYVAGSGSASGKSPASAADLLGWQSFLVGSEPPAAPPAQVAKGKVDIFGSFHASVLLKPETPTPTDPLDVLATLAVPPPPPPTAAEGASETAPATAVMTTSVEAVTAAAKEAPVAPPTSASPSPFYFLQ